MLSSYLVESHWQTKKLAHVHIFIAIVNPKRCSLTVWKNFMLHASCMHTNRCDKNRWAGLTSSFIAFVTGSINSLRTFLLLPKTINPLIRNGGDWTLHGATRNLRLFFLMWKHQQAKIDRHESTTYIHKENIKDTVITFRLFNSEISGPLQRV